MLRYLSALLAFYLASADPVDRATMTLSQRTYKSAFQPQVYHNFGGRWNSPQFCPEGQFASGFRQKTDRGCAGGRECSGLNGIELMCSSEGGQKQLGYAKTEISVPLGQDVNWRPNHWCPEGKFLKSAQILSQPDQGMFADDDAMEGVSFKCDDGTAASPDASEMKRRNRDNWLSWTSCPGETLICGVRVAGEWNMWDNVALDKVSFMCCEKK